MGRGAFLTTVKFVVALPDYLPVFIVGMPDLRAVPAPAVPAADFTGETVCLYPRMGSMPFGTPAPDAMGGSNTNT